MTMSPDTQVQRFSRRLTLLAAAPLVLGCLFVLVITVAQAAPVVLAYQG